MTIQFECPNCNALIAFDSKHIGKRARCQTCGQIFFIPAKDYEKPLKVEPQPERSDPLPGFYRAVFLDSWKLFISRENTTQLVFVLAAVCFKFFTTNLYCCALLVHFITWGWLLGFYLNIIYETAFGLDDLPEIYLGTSATFLWYVIKPFLTFCFTMVVVQFPFIVALILLQNSGVTYSNMWQTHTGFSLLLQILFILGFFFFPAAVLTTAIGRDISLLRPDYIIKLVFKAFLETVAAIQSIFDVFCVQVPIFQHRNINLCWRLSRCLGQVNM